MWLNTKKNKSCSSGKSLNCRREDSIELVETTYWLLAHVFVPALWGKASLHPAMDPGCVYTPGKDPRNLQVRSSQASLFPQKPGGHPKCQSDHTAQRASALSTADLASARTASGRVPSPYNCLSQVRWPEKSKTPLWALLPFSILQGSAWARQAIVWE